MQQEQIHTFPTLIKQWRAFRKCSQLDLALDAGISQRHLSFLETGRAKPSRDMVLNLGQALDLPLRDCNQLLTAAGFAPAFQERNLDSDEMAMITQALKITLDHHEPYPAIVIDRNWNMRMTNRAAMHLIGLLGEANSVWNIVDPSGQRNVYRMTFHDQGLRPLIKNWDEVSRHLFLRLQRDMNNDPNNDELKELFRELGNELNETKLHESPMQLPVMPILPMELGIGDMTLKIFSMIATFGTAQDITADELKIETFFPADEFTTRFFTSLGN